jgi:hypothetical protein
MKHRPLIRGFIKMFILRHFLAYTEIKSVSWTERGKKWQQ